MNKLEKNIYGAICYFVKKSPSFFNENLKESSKAYYYWIDKLNEENKGLEKNAINKYSLLDPSIEWHFTSVNNLCTLTFEQVKKIIKWKNDSDLWRSSNNEIFVEKTIYLGDVFFNAEIENLHSSKNIKASSECVTHCFLTLKLSKDGFFYLLVNWYLKPEVNVLFQNVDVDHIPLQEMKYQTCNPFKFNFSAATIENRESLSKKLILDNINVLYDEIHDLELRLFEALDIDAPSSGCYSLSAYNFINKNYFNKNNYSKHYLVQKHADNNILYQGEDNSKYCTVTNKILLNCKIPHISVISLNSELDIHYDKLENVDVNNLNIFLYIILISNCFDKSNDKYNEYVNSNHIKPTERYEYIYDYYLELIDLIHRTKNINFELKYSFGNHTKVFEKANVITSKMIEKYTAIEKEILLKKNVCSEKVSNSNLIYQKRMTALVVALAVIQIIIALLGLK